MEVPAYLALWQLGFQVERQFIDSKTEWWVARKSGVELSAGSPLEVLGLCLMWTTRGDAWKATDEEIGSYLSRYYPGTPPTE